MLRWLPDEGRLVKPNRKTAAGWRYAYPAMTLLLPVLSLGASTQLAIGRSELVALNVDDVEFVPEGLVLTIRPREDQSRRRKSRPTSA
jgi:hypothetical protein